jgi:hypothetical protein
MVQYFLGLLSQYISLIDFIAFVGSSRVSYAYLQAEGRKEGRKNSYLKDFVCHLCGTKKKNAPKSSEHGPRKMNRSSGKRYFWGQ